MSNMSYCRFQNTEKDLRDCRYALQELLDGTDDSLSAEELEAAQNLVRECETILKLMTDELSQNKPGSSFESILAEANTRAKQAQEDEEVK